MDSPGYNNSVTKLCVNLIIINRNVPGAAQAYINSRIGSKV